MLQLIAKRDGDKDGDENDDKDGDAGDQDDEHSLRHMMIVVLCPVYKIPLKGSNNCGDDLIWQFLWRIVTIFSAKIDSPLPF